MDRNLYKYKVTLKINFSSNHISYLKAQRIINFITRNIKCDFDNMNLMIQSECDMFILRNPIFC